MTELDQNPDFNPDFDCLQTPPLDPLYFSQSIPTSDEALISDIGFLFPDDEDFVLNLDDLDDIYFPTETESLQMHTSQLDDSAPIDPDSLTFEENSGDFTGNSLVSGDQGLDFVDTFLDYLSPESVNCNRDSPHDSPQNSGNGCLNDVGNLVFSSHASSQGSDNSEVPSVPFPESGIIVVDQKVQVEETGKSSGRKRKKNGGESKTEKPSKSSISSENIDGVRSAINEEDDKRKTRLMRNRESAQLSRERKKYYVSELEEKVKAMRSTIADLNGKLSYFMTENATLKQQLGGGAVMCPPPPTGMYPYPWIPYSPYVVNPQGSRVPLVPIPRLNPQQPLSAPKAKKSQSKKRMSKIKKVSSISFIGLVIFILFFGGLAPYVNVNFKNTTDNLADEFYDQHRGRTLIVNGLKNVSGESIGFSQDNNGHLSNRIHCERCRAGKSGYDTDQMELGGSSYVPGSGHNGSEPLVASLYVPRNDKLVKIDGNLIIHSVLASEKAMASGKAHETKNMETGLAIRGISPRLAIPDGIRVGERSSHLLGNTNECKKALSSGSADTLKDHSKSSVADGKLQQWFREGFAGPMLSSGKCTEVIQFDVSPASVSGAIIPAPSAVNISMEHQKNSTHLNILRDRRMLRGIPVTLPRSNLNISADHSGNNSTNENFRGTKSASSIIVSVLVDPREVNDIDISPKSVSRIFVVVLLDSVKYVTYSCVLPRSTPHLVTA